MMRPRFLCLLLLLTGCAAHRSERSLQLSSPGFEPAESGGSGTKSLDGIGARFRVDGEVPVAPRRLEGTVESWPREESTTTPLVGRCSNPELRLRPR